MKSKRKGKRTVNFACPPVILSCASVVGKKEGEGPLGGCFDIVENDAMFGEKTWEAAEGKMQVTAVKRAMEKVKLIPSDIDCAFAGDLLGQLMATSFGLMDMKLPLYGVYGACSTIGESLGLAAMAIDGGFARKVLAATSSHFASAEKEFRFPLDYGNQRPLSATWTVTGSGAFILSEYHPVYKDKARISGMVIGRIVDYGVKDSMNMGACMAPAAADTLKAYFKDTGESPEDFDRIITGDLGYVGQRILIDLMSQSGIDISKQHMDCGIEIYDAKKQDTHSGGSGCGCSAVVLASVIISKLENNEWHRVLFMPTGALLSSTSFKEGESIPGIAHAIIIECSEEN